MISEQSYDPYNFAKLRHVGPSAKEVTEMLEVVGYSSFDHLIDTVLPSRLKDLHLGDDPLPELGEPLTEAELPEDLQKLIGENQTFTSLIGMGFYGTITPPVLIRNILENPAWYTAYTPYQPEISQGRLEVLLNFQTIVSDLTGLNCANASLLDEASAGAEAMAMAYRVSRSKSNKFFVGSWCHPQTKAVIRTRARPLGIEIIEGCPFEDLVPSEVFGALFQYPGTFGNLSDFSSLTEELKKNKAISIFATDLMALTLLKEPAAFGADICIGSTQRFGMPLGFGGPHAAFISTTMKYVRQLPGRIVGVSKDSRGKLALRLALQTREQHIRRQKATSNICTAQVLPAVVASLYGVLHGPIGLEAIAKGIHGRTVWLKQKLESSGFKVNQETFFDTISVEVEDALQIHSKGLANEINFRKIDDNLIGISLDETTTSNVLKKVCSSFGIEVTSEELQSMDPSSLNAISSSFARVSEFMQNPVFNMNRSEAAMTRYIRQLADRDLALDRTMIPLGSCTMKLNATTEMAPITQPQLTNIHPYVPDDQVGGYKKLIEDLCKRLCLITGFDGFSVQPNSGAQGEFAGLMAIKGYHNSIGEGQRDIVLIPKSAHGTNAASAVLAGMKVIEIDTNDDGTIDVDHMRTLVSENAKNISAVMVTYPSTHGVFEGSITEVCQLIHEVGGQVYLDGANLNAMVGILRPGDIGADVSHLNLHKTFCIPHGGGGPGVGPIGVKSHLIPFLPGDPLEGDDSSAVSATKYGSALVLVISWAFIKLMAGKGLALATKLAILNANYLTKRLREKYEICYSGNEGLVGHECIVDTRVSIEGTDLVIDDIAKRLIDNGFHPPTMSFPVAGTLMVEPTESEPKAELDRFINAMLAIADEIQAIKDGVIDKENNPLINAPHTLEDLVGEWDRPYSREEGCLPVGAFRPDRYWTPVNRVDNVFGDRNLVCTRNF